MFRVGIDVGSTTAKIVVLDEQGHIVFSKYERHNARAKETVVSFLDEFRGKAGDVPLSVCITGSVGMGISEKCSLPFWKRRGNRTKKVSTGAPGYVGKSATPFVRASRTRTTAW